MSSHQKHLIYSDQPTTGSALVALNKDGSHDPLLSGKAAARIIGIASQTLAQWRSNRRVEIPFVRVGRRVMYRRSDLDAFIAANTHFGMEVSHG